MNATTNAATRTTSLATGATPHGGAFEEEDDGPFFAAAKKIYPQRVRGRFRQTKWIILAVTLGIYYLLPFVRWDRGPNLPDQAVLVDLENARFYFFFIRIWPYEVYYFTGLLVLAALSLFLMNAIAGRVWCGYLCPQTVWTDLFLAVERFFQGDRRDRIRLDAAPWTVGKIARKGATHAVWLLIAWWTGGAWVLYFSDAPTLVYDLATLQAPATAWIWIGILTATTYLLAGHMREQVCLYMCPWPRIQAALTDDEALNVTYRLDCGEPRASVKEAFRLKALGEPAGDCIDCRACVNVCPTGVDIRLGPQLGCIQCGLCIDACDRMMEKVERPIGLIGYDTMKAVEAREQRLAPPIVRFVRPRTLLYLAVIAIAGGAMLYTLATRSDMTFQALHERNPMFVTLKDGSIRNVYTLSVGNKSAEEQSFRIEQVGLPGAILSFSDGGPPRFKVGPDQTLTRRAFVAVDASALRTSSTPIRLALVNEASGERLETDDHFFGP
jgi:cytochrome c oxidase accessory protein FixG